MKFKHFSQLEMTDCGPACLQMVLHYFGKNYSLHEIREQCNITRVGVTFKDLTKGAESLGLNSLIGKVNTDKLAELPLPCILHWNQEHFVVLYEIGTNRSGEPVFSIADPAFGKITLSKKEFELHWRREDPEGIAMFLEPDDDFVSRFPVQVAESQISRSWNFVKPHLTGQLSRISVLALLLGGSAMISWLFPVLLTKLIDEGVRPGQVNVVIAVLLTQFALFLGQVLMEWGRSMVAAHFSTDLSISIITGFIRKLVRLPIKFFDTRLYTDILQKIDDHSHVEGFLTHMLLQFVFSFISFVFLASLLLYYNVSVFAVTIVLSIAGIGWILLFLRRRRMLDYARFRIRSDNRNVLFETIIGMPEVKINNAHESRFETIKEYQQQLYSLNIKATNLFQMQQVGVHAIGQFKNILVTFLCAYWVIQDQMTLGVMMSIGYIIGQLNQPLDSFVSFFRSAQDANIALNRLDEIQQKENENGPDKVTPPAKLKAGVVLDHVSFKYEGSNSPYVLHDINLQIPAGKTTAIVGASGSGKTTLMKLLLSFYKPQQGVVTVDGQDMSTLNSDSWRDKIGVVLQDGYIFSGTIAENIALSEKHPDQAQLRNAAGIACLLEFIDALPMGFQTKIGNAGVDLSGGQKQRILIARAVYKNPDIIFFDEATNALDATNERHIMENLAAYFQSRTVVVIAHRLSTVKNADQIIVMENGHLVEAGNHSDLTIHKGRYFELVRNQLELGN